MEHIDEHGISQDEFERIVQFPAEIGVDRHGNPTAYGYGDDDRWVKCIYRMLDDITVEPITAFPL